jgi:Na+-driven multidrug efflux pump
MIALLPLIGIATAVISVTGAAFGASEFAKLDTGFVYAVRTGIMIEIPVMVLVFVFAPQITSVFTIAEETGRIADDLTEFLRISCIFFPVVSMGMLSSSMFQGTGRGIAALMVNLVRTVVLSPPLSWVFAFTLGWGLTGVWWGIVAANVVGAFLAFIWAKVYIRGLKAAEPGRARPGGTRE